MRLYWSVLAIALALRSSLVMAKVIASDDRLQLTSNQITGPLKSIVALIQVDPQQASSKGCTGTLVGPSLVLTSAHCLSFTAQGKLIPIEVRSFARWQEENNLLAVVTEAYFDSDRSKRSSDWALLRISKELGLTRGYLEIQELTKISQYNHLLLPGASPAGDEKNYDLLIHEDCRARDLPAAKAVGGPSSGLLYHECDSDVMTSGAPLLKCSQIDSWPYSNCKIVALHRGSIGPESKSYPFYFYSPLTPGLSLVNVGVLARHFKPRLEQLLKLEGR